MNSSLDSIVRALDRLVAAQQKGIWDYAGTAAIVLTLFVVAWYTYETYTLRTETQRQNERSLMPILAFDVKVQAETEIPVIQNFGSGPAFNIAIESFTGDRRALTFDSPSHLAPSEHKRVDIIVDWELPEQYHIFDMRELKPLFESGQLPEHVQTCIRYDSVHQKHFESAFTIKFNPDTDYMFITFEGVREMPAQPPSRKAG